MEILRTKMLFLTTRIASAGSVVLAIMAALAPDTKSFRAEFIAIMIILAVYMYSEGKWLILLNKAMEHESNEDEKGDE